MIKKLKPKSEFAKNVLTLMTGTTIAQAIPIAISPILTRLYTPEDFGSYSLFVSIITFFSVISTARYEMAIVLPKSEKEAINILALSFIVSVVIAFVLSLILIVFKNKIMNFVGYELGDFIYFMPLIVLLSGISQSLYNWASRKKFFSLISKTNIWQSIGSSMFQLFLGYINFDKGLILGNIIGRFFSFFIYIFQFLKNDVKLLKFVNPIAIFYQMKKYKAFPMVNTIHVIIDMAKIHGVIILISILFGTKILGFYALSLRALQIPVSLIGVAIGEVLYQKFSVMKNNNECIYPYVKKIIYILFIVALPIFLIFFLYGPKIFMYVFGKNWEIAGIYSQILSPYIFLHFLLSPISTLPLIFNKQKEILILSLIGNFLFVGVFLVCAKLNFLTILKLLSLTQVLFYLYLFFWYNKLLKNQKCNNTYEK